LKFGPVKSCAHPGGKGIPSAAVVMHCGRLGKLKIRQKEQALSVTLQLGTRRWEL